MSKEAFTLRFVTSLVLFAMVGCARTVSDDLGPRLDGGPVAAPYYARWKSGSRLKVRVVDLPDGTHVFDGIIDSELALECTPLLAEDGRVRCLPATGAISGGVSRGGSDEIACVRIGTMPNHGPTCLVRGYALDGPTVWHTVEPSPASACALDGEAHRSVTKVPADRFAELSAGTLEYTSEIGTQVWRSPDGLEVSFRDHLVDKTRNKGCRVDDPYRPTCLPETLFTPEAAYRDRDCAIPMIGCKRNLAAPKLPSHYPAPLRDETSCRVSEEMFDLGVTTEAFVSLAPHTCSAVAGADGTAALSGKLYEAHAWTASRYAGARTTSVSWDVHGSVSLPTVHLGPVSVAQRWAWAPILERVPPALRRGAVKLEGGPYAGEACIFSKGPSGDVQCIPARFLATEADVFSDVSCTVPASVASDTYVFQEVDPRQDDACDPRRAVFWANRATQPAESGYRRLGDGRCVPGPRVFRTTPVDLSELPSGQRRLLE